MKYLLQNGKKTVRKESTCSFLIDLFGLYVLFSHFRPLDVILENSFFQM